MTASPPRDQTILIVDDEEVNVRLLQRLLTTAGYRNLVSTTDSKEAVALYRESGPDLVLLDLRMPPPDGFAVMEHLSRLISPDDYLPVLVLTADISGASRQKALASGAKDFLTKPFDYAEVLARVNNLLDTRSLHLQLRRYNELLEDKVRERTSELWDTIGKLELAHKDLRLAQEETIHRLSLAVEFHDDETSRHIERMSRYCGLLAGRAGEGGWKGDMLRIASKMHDIGKIGVPDSILLKPGPLTSEEFEIMKGHSDIGYRILRDSRSTLAQTGAMIAWTHHEKLDGTGYPRGLRGDEIPIVGRIAAIADVFDALTTDRIYRKAFTLPRSISTMQESRGQHFDPDLLDLFFDSMDAVLAVKAELDEIPTKRREKD